MGVATVDDCYLNAGEQKLVIRQRKPGAKIKGIRFVEYDPEELPHNIDD